MINESGCKQRRRQRYWNGSLLKIASKVGRSECKSTDNMAAVETWAGGRMTIPSRDQFCHRQADCSYRNLTEVRDGPSEV